MDIDGLAEAIDQLLGNGVVLGAEIEISVADVPLCHVSARLLAATVGRAGRRLAEAAQESDPAGEAPP